MAVASTLAVRLNHVRAHVQPWTSNLDANQSHIPFLSFGWTYDGKGWHSVAILAQNLARMVLTRVVGSR